MVKVTKVKKAKEEKNVIHKAYKFRVYPKPLQVTLFAKTFGCTRFVYNHYLFEKNNLYKYTKTSISKVDCNNDCNELKNLDEYKFLKEVDKFSLTNAIYDLDKAFQNFFEKRAKYPKFKKKKDNYQSYTTNFTNGNIKVDFEKRELQLPKVGKLKFRCSKKWTSLPGVIKSATVTKQPNGHYYVSVLVEISVEKKPEMKLSYTEEEIQALKEACKVVGVDLGLKHLAILSNGLKKDNPKFYVKEEKRLAKLQQTLSQKKYGSKKYKKLQKKIAKLHAHIANMRKDLLHKETSKLVNENQIIAIEDLHVKGMVRNPKLSKAISDVGWGMFKEYLLYKAQWSGKTVVQINRFYPSSKECSHCHEINKMLTLSDREWACPSCGTLHDRDENASKNILEEGLRLLK